MGCTDPIIVLTDLQWRRCRRSGECQDAKCLVPKAPLMRLRVANEGKEGVLLWSGPKEEVLEEGECS